MEKCRKTEKRNCEMEHDKVEEKKEQKDFQWQTELKLRTENN